MLKNRIENPMLRGIVEWLIAIAFAALLFFVVRSFLFRVAHVNGNSMEPTLSHGDMVVLNRLSYLFSVPRVDDIVAFPFAENPSEFYIKRVIAVPGDMVDLQNGVFLINGIPLVDDFSLEPIVSFGDIRFPTTIEAGHFFVLGDNRNASMDSRFASVGNVPARDMVGRVAVRIFPFNRLGGVD
ncbi:MAG: signal peptidase I [Defluviitaleaceae bacterium]|nr:signal peptidase I [Defluviitaleaceae bacterium]